MHLQTILLTNHREGWHFDHTPSSLTETWKSNKNKKSKDKPFSILLRGREEGPLKCSRVVRVYSSLQISSSQGYAQQFLAGTHTQSNMYLKVTLGKLPTNLLLQYMREASAEGMRKFQKRPLPILCTASQLPCQNFPCENDCAGYTGETWLVTI